MYYTYVLYSKRINKRYIGSTSYIEKRLIEHNNRKCRLTKSGIPWILVYKEEYISLSETRKRELFLKSGVGRKFLDNLLEGNESILRRDARVVE